MPLPIPLVPPVTGTERPAIEVNMLVLLRSIGSQFVRLRLRADPPDPLSLDKRESPLQ